MSVTFVIPGDPQALRRHRSARRGERIVQYDDPGNKEPKARVQEAWKLAGHPSFKERTALSVTLSCSFKRPKSHFGTGRNSHMLKSSVTWHVSRPDSSNIAKLVEDALIGFAWPDDAQICRWNVSKRYCQQDELPHVDVVVMDLDAPKPMWPNA